MTAEVASAISLVVSWGLLAIIVNFITASLFILIRQINEDDNDEVADYLNWSSKHLNYHFYYLMPDDDNNFSGSAVLDFRKCKQIAAKVLDLGFHKLTPAARS